MQHFNRKIDFRATENNITKRLPIFPDNNEDLNDMGPSQQWRNFESEASPGRSHKNLSPCEQIDRRHNIYAKQEDEQTITEQANRANRMLQNRNRSRERLRETSPLRNPPDQYRLRTTQTSNSVLLGSPLTSNCQYRQPPGSLMNMRKSYGSEQRPSQISMQRSRELSNIEETLNNLSTKVLNAKKELERKNDKHKEQRNFQPRYIILEQEEYPFHKEELQESELSKEQSVSTVIKNRNSIKQPKVTITSLVHSAPKPMQSRGFDFNPYSPRKHNQYYISELVRAVSYRNSLAREHLRTSMQILRVLQSDELPTYSEVQSRKVNLKRKEYYKDKKTLVFDLDETLIHCNQNPLAPSDVVLTINMDSGDQIQASINIRPYAITLLNQLSKNFELIVFTASQSCYADVVLDYLDPDHKLIEHRLYRQHCFKNDKDMYIKDLRIINRGLHEMVLIDNAAYSYAYQLQNGIPIIPYYDGSNDFQLRALETYLTKLSTAKDIRDINKKTFKLHHYHKFETVQELVEQLYQS